VGDTAPTGIDRRRFLRLTAVGAGSLALLATGAGGAGAAPPSATEMRFDQLDGVPLGYWRWRDGTAGRRVERQAFYSTADFHRRLVVWVRDLKDISARYGGLVGMNRIITAGTFVDKPLEHGKGMAFDLDQVRWSNGTSTPYAREHASPDLRTRRRYLAVDAVCRRHFHWVLDGGFNAEHADHLHLDTAGGALVCDRGARSDTAFVQQVVNAFQGGRLPVDGAWGPVTQRAFEESRRRLGVAGDPYATPAVWQQWLLRVAACGFRDVPFAQAPVEQPDPMAALIDPILTPVQDAVLEALGLLG
jgi:hypothetical protein